MPPLRPLPYGLHITKRLALSSVARRNGHNFLRNCSCSASPRLQQSVPTSFHRPITTPLDGTSADSPTPPKDHRTLAKSHDLFTTSPYSPGSPLILPNGAHIFHKLQAFLRAQYSQFGFKEVITPNIYKKELWEKSGHWENYAEDMFSVQGRGMTGDEGEFGLKPMNCPGHCLLFGEDVKSFRDLPVRLADFSALHRNEISGALSGLTRVRRFHQDDAHIFCRKDQILVEIAKTLKFVGMVYKTFGLGPYKLLLSTRPKDSFIGTIEEWDRAEQQLTAALKNSGSDWAINEGDGAFYGPKIDIVLKDCNGKDHQTATIQLDFQLPQRFDLQYQASPEEYKHEPPDAGLSPELRRPVIIHRAIYGSIERFMALLIEHYNGQYPFWLSPRPAIILSLNADDAVIKHVSRLQAVLSGLRYEEAQAFEDATLPEPLPLSSLHIPVDVDISNRSLGKKVAEAKLKKYNHILVVGHREARGVGAQVTVSNQPNVEATLQVLEQCVTGTLTSTERSRQQVFLGWEETRDYFQKLSNLYL